MTTQSNTIMNYKFQTRMNGFKWIWYVLSGKYNKDVEAYNNPNGGYK